MLKKLNALQELSVPKQANKILPFILALGIAPESAIALSNNCAQLFYMLGSSRPKNIKDILTMYSLDEIAQKVTDVLEYDEYHFDEKLEGACFDKAL